MNKYERLDEIARRVNEKGTIRITDIVEDLNVSDMTVRRDLIELEEQGILTKIHGGARSNQAFQYKEMSHHEKHTQKSKEKYEIAKKAAELIEDGNIIFLGPGTTVEMLAKEIENKRLSVVTNCLPVFQILQHKRSEQFSVYLIGGSQRKVTESFVGEMANTLLEKMRFSKIFFSANGIKGNEVMTSSYEEAYTQKLAISHSNEKYILADDSKIGKEDFVSFCELKNLTAIVTNRLNSEQMKAVQQYIEVI
ncbi:DeoR/GlpR family DNA-binding transcription regulator [Staphylococcus lutrae]|uniref:Lactose phosphotransferase system repressor n=1 Tax=Staphylococcus lutrae TaxID=155085 RepID=A0AAC9RNF5_9STAP|nr:DeoR/GlpR family DNA-binding transcription regulator [Staphylococcus lutrae]ARJ50346.1 DeoR family transcriptional regulator [Staphylococcus lutrae]PNZ35475.1 DeoR/GlpR transcriptional regulator [Staphylococcus lutrae]